ncbi:penicillin-binding transpeptidase domain-containing protein [Sporosarcina pasteurii]|uniref:Penicillin-binding protein 2 n=1 Tax=Sporosarcina pasteurii TaxID=1474 RepID=A0A380BG20_SPOPA|nr:penicillin-binding transpeptidase domain-containing protein [Sporosarcina pasteurii]MDS9470494.1 penicillin-binding transpeptidase domain-containing protein [Sporosarcina pasteurii]QBQ05810.1 stage V sporulation protein D [Sporosarcina pasteurii]SUJ00406.1 Penicillin-binding protein 2 [Sporosarcina pasteurii]
MQTKKRLRAVFVIFLILSCAVLIKLFHVQIIKHEFLKGRAEENWDIEIPFGGMRGSILDRNGELIVGNQLAPTLYYMPAQNPDAQHVASTLAEILRADAKELEKKLSQKTYMVKIAPEGKNITKKQADEIAKLQIPGLYTGVDFVRYYPKKEALSRLLGFTGYDGQGLAGIEYAYDDFLQGTGDRIRLYTDAKGIPLPHVDDGFKTGAEGASVGLTIDLEMQQIVERELLQAMEKFEATQALAIVMNPKTGELLSLASAPTFHPADYQQVDPSIYNRNLPVWMTFEPGSTFKIITLAAGIEEQVINLHKENFHDPGFVRVANARLRCWKREGHGQQTFLEVVENSCNPGFVTIGQRLGGEKLNQYIEDFGFGRTTDSGIAGESKGILFSKEAFGPVEQATTSFGQGISVTPIQQVQAVAAAINGGNLYKPYIVKEIVDANGKTLRTFEPELKKKVISEETSVQVREALESVVANGSGRSAFTDGLRVGGKTGTAQKVVDGTYKDGEYIVSFIGFAPADDPELLVYVAVDNPKNSVQFGGVIAAPIVGRIIEEIAPIAGITKRENQLEKDYRWGDEITHRVPDLTGMTKETVRTQLYTYQIKWHGSGEKVKYQMPAVDTLISVDDVIHVYTE